MSNRSFQAFEGERKTPSHQSPNPAQPALAGQRGRGIAISVRRHGAIRCGKTHDPSRAQARAPQKGMMRRLTLCLLPLPWLAHVSAAPVESVATCPPGSVGGQALTLLRTRPILDSYLYLLSRFGKSEAVFGSAELSRGTGLQVTCVGEQASVLVFSGEFTANCLQGAAVAFDPVSRRLLRIDFAERNRPHWIGLGPAGLSVIFDNSGHESRSKYLIYTSTDSVEELDVLPVNALDGNILIDLTTDKHQAN